MAKLYKGMHVLFTENIIQKLNGGDIYTTDKFMKAEIKQICEVTGLSHKDINSIKEYISNKNGALLRNGLGYYKELVRKSAIIETGIKGLDNLLSGGLLTGNLYEICGTPSSGKTQICFTILKNVAHNLSQTVFYIDTKRDFSPRRIKMMLNSVNMTETAQIMSNIKIFEANTLNELNTCLHNIKDQLIDNLTARLIILDSLPALCTSSDYVNNNMLLNHAANVMHFLTNECYTTIVVTNVLTKWSEGNFQWHVTENVACGKYWKGVPQTRVKVENDSGRLKLEIMRSNGCVSGKSFYATITEEGVT